MKTKSPSVVGAHEPIRFSALESFQDDSQDCGYVTALYLQYFEWWSSLLGGRGSAFDVLVIRNTRVMPLPNVGHRAVRGPYRYASRQNRQGMSKLFSLSDWMYTHVLLVRRKLLSVCLLCLFCLFAYYAISLVNPTIFASHSTTLINHTILLFLLFILFIFLSEKKDIKQRERNISI